MAISKSDAYFKALFENVLFLHPQIFLSIIIRMPVSPHLPTMVLHDAYVLTSHPP